MTEKIFLRGLWYSLIGHIAFFSIVNFSFGSKIPTPRYAGVSFVGALLRTADVCAPQVCRVPQGPSPAAASGMWLVPGSRRVAFGSRDYCVKPQNLTIIQEEKIAPEVARVSAISLPKRKESVVMLYPQLPYHFLLYFVDRQVAHLELEFLISSYEETNSVTIKRKISSGNLEVDLLSIRYLNHYLSMQLGRFPLNQWQTVKIDFRPKNE